MSKRILTEPNGSGIAVWKLDGHSIRQYGARYNQYNPTIYAVIIPDDAKFEGI